MKENFLSFFSFYFLFFGKSGERPLILLYKTREGFAKYQTAGNR